MGCCGCFGFAFASKPKRLVKKHIGNHVSQDFLLNVELEDEDNCSHNGDSSDNGHGDEGELRSPTKRSEVILMYRSQHVLICREFPVKETHKLIRSEDENGNMVNEYVRECKIGSGSYGKVVLYRSSVDGKHYAIKAFHKSHLSKLRVAPCETTNLETLANHKSISNLTACFFLYL
ncbi:serine/threonine-protein kinase GRIK1-like [Actinidia eriantha]|uniref:serine/threonine-protein kinase GRIK1-like n=1 Tax=Actinidia eriantha TaxID=165200 RepID=UPI00258EF8D3|nr:serine/threonine-protein kinase GRIK1-like [Actinidia eriantha]XP_057509288.1 serine/threonine-protein kinase GRIK1-like [Actinidia eriantha]